ncbi:YbgC/FadM family acyl-CoA thioesterase [Sphingomonas immobilis]|uniref:YbgC/FadM family acyl-CoA thioesterase n=1 Tax=Sphingomonas immobilis TaxID=3063997 RepID=A0ABT9A294_9SPHN|nr:YbgC/FadM family acyl-CoA thioesterase [Sphingomonas sp. CA1-15]MDO7843957.1 YbgC/FadM family acyl-CoA thioesterase [Sphingomonas sp. CA1-15]
MAADALDCPTGGRIADGEHRFPLRVYFEDTDFSGAVYHANYLNFMERARSDMLRVAGIDQRAAYEAGEGSYVVSALAIRYLRPARFDDTLVVHSRPTQVRAAAVHIQQRVMRGRESLAEADVTVAFVAPSGRPKRMSAAWTEIFGRVFAIHAQQGESPA